VFTAFPARPSVVRAPLLLAYDAPKLIQFYLSNLEFSWVEYFALSFNRTIEGRAAAFVQFPKSLPHDSLPHVLVDTLAYAHIGRSGIHDSSLSGSLHKSVFSSISLTRTCLTIQVATDYTAL